MNFAVFEVLLTVNCTEHEKHWQIMYNHDKSSKRR